MKDLNGCLYALQRSVCSILALLLLFLFVGFSSQALSSDFVRIGSLNNPKDTLTGCGSVGYEFEMQSRETTNSEYAKFLNAVARKSDPHSLYNNLMGVHFFGGIERIALGQEYIYRPREGYNDLPVVFVSWFSAARYSNWKHYGSPDTGESGIGATEGSDSIGAYNTSELYDLFRSQTITRSRNKGALYWIPSCDEWVKAGFYNPAASEYFTYATGNNGEPRAEIESSVRYDPRYPTATFFDGRWAAPYPHLTPVGSHSRSASAFGTFDQGGNVMEWLEDVVGQTHRMARGGSVFMYSNSLRRNYLDSDRPDKALSTFGFRLARSSGKSATAAMSNVTDPNIKPPPALIAAPKQQTKRVDQVGPVVIDLVPIEHEGNENDPLYKTGGVEYKYWIGRTEITNSQYATFLNAVASENDKYCLYTEAMENGIVGGISRRHSANIVKYDAKPGWEQRPATYLSWYDAIRFVNWLHYGAPQTGNSELGTTEGDDRIGAYDTRAFGGCLKASAEEWEKQPRQRNKGARYWVPSVSEWHKAAYFDPGRFGGRRYWSYPTRTDDPPVASPPPGDRHSANYQFDDKMGEGPPFYVSEVGAYGASKSYFGTLDQGGNVWEWLEDWKRRGTGGACWRCDEWARSLKGGSFNYTFIGLSAANVDPGAPNQKYPFYGLRIAASDSNFGYSPPNIFQSIRINEIKLIVSNNRWLILGSILVGASSVLLLFSIIFLFKRRLKLTR